MKSAKTNGMNNSMNTSMNNSMNDAVISKLKGRFGCDNGYTIKVEVTATEDVGRYTARVAELLKGGETLTEDQRRESIYTSDHLIIRVEGFTYEYKTHSDEISAALLFEKIASFAHLDASDMVQHAGTYTLTAITENADGSLTPVFAKLTE